MEEITKIALFFKVSQEPVAKTLQQVGAEAYMQITKALLIKYADSLDPEFLIGDEKGYYLCTFFGYFLRGLAPVECTLGT